MTGTTSGAPAATPARIYDFLLGGTHNFPADREAARVLVELAPQVPAVARANRAFLRRAVRYLATAGVRQFLDIGSGIPTAGNVHEVAQTVPDARVVYVDIDPVAVAESLEILDGNEGATAVRGDVRDIRPLLEHPDLHRLIDLDRPVGILLTSVLHFVADDAQAYASVDLLVGAAAPGSHLVISHGAPVNEVSDPTRLAAGDVYEQRTTTPVHARGRDQVERFFAGLELVDPGLVRVTDWRPAPDDPVDFVDATEPCAMLAAVGRRP